MSASGKRLLRIVAIAALGAVVLAAVASACPLCSEADDGGAGVWRGMYLSILLMIAVPFSMAGTLVFLVLRARKRNAASLPPARAPLSFPGSREARS